MDLNLQAYIFSLRKQLRNASDVHSFATPLLRSVFQRISDHPSFRIPSPGAWKYPSRIYIPARKCEFRLGGDVAFSGSCEVRHRLPQWPKAPRATEPVPNHRRTTLSARHPRRRSYGRDLHGQGLTKLARSDLRGHAPSFYLITLRPREHISALSGAPRFHGTERITKGRKPWQKLI